jgi:hypothetical protein
LSFAAQRRIRCVYCKSPELLIVIDSKQFNGWRQLHDSYGLDESHRMTMRIPVQMANRCCVHSSDRAF